MRLIRRFVLCPAASALLLAAVVLAAAAESVTPPAVRIPETARPPALDGTVGETEWQGASVLGDFVVLSGKTEGQRSTNVTAWLLRDAEWLYIGFDVRHPQPTAIVPKVTQRDGRVQGENCVKVLFDPGTGGKLWYHLRLSAGNVWSDQRSVAGSGELGWNCPLRSATRITDTGWQAEVAIPCAVVMEMGEPEQARLNLLVHVFEPIFDPSMVEIGQERTVLSWAPVGKDWWRTPERFGRVEGLAGAAFKAPFLPVLERAEVGAYRLDGGRMAYDVAVAARNASGRAGVAALRVSDEPDGAGGAVTNIPLALEGNAALTLRVPVPVASARRRTVRVDLLSPETGEVWNRALIENPAVLDLFRAYLDRNYYTTEPEAQAICETGLPADGLPGTTLTVSGPDGRTWGETRAVAPRTAIVLPLAAVAPGRYALRVAHRAADGGVISEQTLDLVKRPPKPGLEWKIDRANRVLLHDGQPQFVYGMLLGGWDRGAYNEANYREVAAAGFNAVMYWAADGSIEAARQALDTMQRHGLYLSVPVCTFAKPPAFAPTNLPPGIPPSDPSHIKGYVMKLPTKPERNRVYADVFRQAVPLIRQGIATIKEHPALMAYEGFDEPLDDSWFDQYVQGRELYRLIDETDGYHPTRVNWNFPPAGEQYTDWADFLACDPYWSPPVGTLRDAPNYVAKRTAQLDRRGEKERKPVWLTPVLEMYSGHYKRATLPAEQRVQTWLAMIHRASGLFYFVYPVIHQATWDTMRQLGREFRDLNPILAAPVPDQRIAYEPGGFDPDQDILPDVQVSLRRNPAGGYVLLAANAQPWPVTARYALAIPGLAGPARRMFGPETYPLAAGSFSERLEPFATRAYLLGRVPAAPAPPAGAIEMTVRFEAHKEGYVPETEVPRAGRPGKRNLMPNPSFEDAALPDYPDYWWLAAHTFPRYPEERTGRERPIYTLDRDRPFHGRAAFRLTAASNRQAYCYFKLSPQHDRPTEYAWSAWMRADRAGARIVWSGPGMKQRRTTFELTPEWQRYYAVVTMPAHAHRHLSFAMSLTGGAEGARAWVDAMQLERGVEPTEFEP